MEPAPPDPLAAAGEIKDVLELVGGEARRFLAELDQRPVRLDQADTAVMALAGPLPEAGAGALEALRRLLAAEPAVVASAGPRFFHYVIGGATPAALGADWMTSVWDQNAGGWVASPLAAHLETVALDWLKDLFRLPPEWGGVLTTGATMANYTGLAAARQWWGHRHDFDAAEEGLAGHPPVPVLTSGHIHISAMKALAMLGIGRASVRKLAADPAGTLDLSALERALVDLRGAPAIIVANAGEVNAGAFDPIAAMAELADRHRAWLHVDGAFGLFSRLAPAALPLTAGIEGAHSVISDGHKWLNVPHDCGFAFVHDPRLLLESFVASADYLPPEDDPNPVYGYMGPEMSRRARALTVWATLAAYGRAGYQAMVERHLTLARHLAERVDEAPDLERLADAPLNIVCFRYRPVGATEAELDDLNERLGAAILDDGRVFVGTTRYGGKMALRPAIVNWRITGSDVDLLVDVVRELGSRLEVNGAGG